MHSLIDSAYRAISWIEIRQWLIPREQALLPATNRDCAVWLYSPVCVGG
jgi:hypothetical protein